MYDKKSFYASRRGLGPESINHIKEWNIWFSPLL